MKPQIDLTVLAAGYAHRRASSLSHARRAAADADPSAGDWAVDVGGGPGDHAAVWAGLAIRPIVLDPTPAMLSMARSKPGVVPILGVAERLPFAAASVALVYYHLSIHPDDRRYFTFRLGSRLLRCACLPMGWSASPYYFTKLMRVPVTYLRSPASVTARTAAPT